MPIVDAYKNSVPRKAAVLGGVFTGDSLLQMERHGFKIAYVDLPAIISAFQCVSIDANYGEATTDEAAQKKVDAWEKLPNSSKARVVSAVTAIIAPKMQELKEELVTVIGRRIETVRVLPLHSSAVDRPSVEAAIKFIHSYGQAQGDHPVARYEVQIRYSNGDKLDGQFKDKSEAVNFLETFHEAVIRKLQEIQQKLEQDETSEE